MSRGKYSPWCYRNKGSPDYYFNVYGEVPAEWNKEHYDEKTMLAHHDSEGFDSYGYSAFDEEGNYVGVGQGIDRYGYTENDYLKMDDDTFNSVCGVIQTVFKRKRDEKPTMKRRKTKAERDAELKAARNAEIQLGWEKFKAEYPNRFAALLFDFFKFSATDYNLDIVRTENNYEFCWGAGYNRQSVVLQPVPPTEYDWQYEQSFDYAEAAVQEERDRIAEAERKQQIRQNALNKLTPEEKKALGFSS